MNNEKEFERKIEILLAALMAIENNTRGKLVSLAQANWYLENVNRIAKTALDEFKARKGEGMQESKNEKKSVTIIVEGTPHEWPKDEITYAEVVTLEFPDYPQHPEIIYSVKYKNGHGNKPEGTPSPGGSVKVKDGMIFNVSTTGQS